MHLLKELSTGLLHLLLPKLCAGCGQPLVMGEDVLCTGCGMQLPVTGFHDDRNNEAALRFAGRLRFEHATAYAFFTAGGLMQHLLHLLKYKRQQDIGQYLGTAFGADLCATAWINDVDAIVPVPLHPAKEAARGFNQSRLIAAGMAEATGRPCLPAALRRTRVTESQTRKSREERVGNVSGAFCINSASDIAGKHLLLVDDVLTTGATLEAAGAALLEAPEVRISFATLAVASV